MRSEPGPASRSCAPVRAAFESAKAASRSPISSDFSSRAVAASARSASRAWGGRGYFLSSGSGGDERLDLLVEIVEPCARQLEGGVQLLGPAPGLGGDALHLRGVARLSGRGCRKQGQSGQGRKTPTLHAIPARIGK